MSIRDEVLKLIDSERTKLVGRDAVLAEREDRKKALFTPMKAVIEQILDTAPELTNSSYHSTGAWIKLGRDPTKAEVSWSISVDFERETKAHVDGAPYFIAEEERFYDFNGFQPSKTTTSKKI